MKLTEVKVAPQNNDKEYYDFYGIEDFINSRDAQRILNSVEIINTDVRVEGGENWEDVIKSMVHMTKSEAESLHRKFYNLHRHYMKMDPKYPTGAYGGYAELSQLDRVGRIDDINP